jgi:alpha-beta hydrolase superfamily lysophospholipase
LRLAIEIDRNIRPLRERINCLYPPLLILAAGDDHLVNTKEALDIFNRIDSPIKRYHIFPESYHEMFNEEGVEESAYDILNQWLLEIKNLAL